MPTKSHPETKQHEEIELKELKEENVLPEEGVIIDEKDKDDAIDLLDLPEPPPIPSIDWEKTKNLLDNYEIESEEKGSEKTIDTPEQSAKKVEKIMQSDGSDGSEA